MIIVLHAVKRENMQFFYKITNIILNANNFTETYFLLQQYNLKLVVSLEIFSSW